MIRILLLFPIALVILFIIRIYKKTPDQIKLKVERYFNKFSMITQFSIITYLSITALDIYFNGELLKNSEKIRAFSSVTEVDSFQSVINFIFSSFLFLFFGILLKVRFTRVLSLVSQLLIVIFSFASLGIGILTISKVRYFLYSNDIIVICWLCIILGFFLSINYNRKRE